PDYTYREQQQKGGYRTFLAVPLLREGQPIGVLGLGRKRVDPFTDKQIELLATFADQAVIAIENARLFEAEQQRTSELRESLEQQIATSKVLEVISSSPGDLKPVFEAILANAVRLCGAKFGNLYLREGDGFRAAAMHNAPSAYAAQRAGIVHRSPYSTVYQAAHTKQPAQTADITKLPGYLEGDPWLTSAVSLGGYRGVLSVPMLHEDESIGTITIFRQEAEPFANKQIELLTNFAKQAVIAIENARLLNELKQRTADLSESLERQTATSEVLKVISSSPGDLQPVFDAILANATDLCGAGFASLRLSEGDQFRTVSLYNAPAALVEHWRGTPLVRPHPESALGRAALTKQVVQIDDVREGPAYSKRDPIAVAAADLGGYRTVLAVPLLREDVLVGAISIYRQEVRPFTDKQIELVTNFADQAVIAIENTRLLSELRESLRQQTATADVLKVISSSPGDLAPVFDSILVNVTRICDASFANLALYDGQHCRMAAMHNAPAAFSQLRGKDPILPADSVGMGVVENRKPLHIQDLHSDSAFRNSRLLDLAGARSTLGVPMLKDGRAIGAIMIYRREVRPFTDKQI